MTEYEARMGEFKARMDAMKLELQEIEKLNNEARPQSGPPAKRGRVDGESIGIGLLMLFVGLPFVIIFGGPLFPLAVVVVGVGCLINAFCK